MKTLITAVLVFALASMCLIANAQAPSIVWQKCLGGSGDDWTDANTGILRLKNGDYLAWGTTNSHDGNFPVNKGQYDAFVVKLDKKGNIIWKKTYGGSGDENLWGVIEDKNGDFIATGRTSSNNGDVSGNHGGQDLWVLRLGSNGTLKSQHCYGGTENDGANATLTQYNDQDIIIASATSSNNGDVSGNHGGTYDGWLLRINPAGAIVWQKCIGGTGSDILNGTVSVINNVIVASGNTNSPSGNTGYHGASGGVDPYGFPDGDALLVRTTLNGVLLSAKCYGGTEPDGAHGYAETADGNIVITTVSLSQNGDISHPPASFLFMWVVKISLTTGNVMWDWSSPEVYLNAGFGIFPTKDGGVVSVGAIAPDVDWTTWDGYAVKLNASGSLVWSKRLGGSNGEQLNMGVEAKNGDLAIVAITSSNDGDVSGNHGGIEDSWLVGLSEHGNHSPARMAAPNSAFSVHPNPLSAKATFSFSLSESGNVSIDVLDATGRLVQSVCNAIYENGPHEIVWNTAGISAGSYYGRFRTPDNDQTLRLTILK